MVSNEDLIAMALGESGVTTTVNTSPAASSQIATISGMCMWWKVEAVHYMSYQTL